MSSRTSPGSTTTTSGGEPTFTFRAPATRRSSRRARPRIARASSGGQRLRMRVHRRRRARLLQLHPAHPSADAGSPPDPVGIRAGRLGGGQVRGADRHRARPDARAHRPAPEPARIGLAMVQEEGRGLGVDTPVVHLRGRARHLRRRAGDLRELPGSRRGGSRVRAPEPPRVLGTPRGRPVAQADPTRASSGARAPLRPLRSLGSRAGSLHALFRADRRPAVRARVLRRRSWRGSAGPSRAAGRRHARRSRRRRCRPSLPRALWRPERRPLRPAGAAASTSASSPTSMSVSRVSATACAWSRPVRTRSCTSCDTPEPVPLEAIEARWPGLPATLSKSSGIGFVLARAKDGPVCFWRGEIHRLADARGRPVR